MKGRKKREIENKSDNNINDKMRKINSDITCSNITVNKPEDSSINNSLNDSQCHLLTLYSMGFQPTYLGRGANPPNTFCK